MADPGFEITLPGDENGTFIPFDTSKSTTGIGLMLIDHYTRMPIDEYEEAARDPHSQGRGPFLLTMLGLSLYAARPTWTFDRIASITDHIDLNDLAVVNENEGEESESPLPAESESGAEDTSASLSDESSTSAPQTKSPTGTVS